MLCFVFETTVQISSDFGLLAKAGLLSWITVSSLAEYLHRSIQETHS